MTKPDDIPQDVWAKAQEVALDIHVDKYGVLDFDGAEIAISRAILAAKSEEREECAKIAFRVAQHVNASADDIANAIRLGDRSA